MGKIEEYFCTHGIRSMQRVFQSGADLIRRGGALIFQAKTQKFLLFLRAVIYSEEPWKEHIKKKMPSVFSTYIQYLC